MDLRQGIDWQMLVTQVWSCFCLCEVTIDCCVISISSLESNGSANGNTSASVVWRAAAQALLRK